MGSNLTAVAPNEHSLGIAPSANFSTPDGCNDDDKESTKLIVDPDDPLYRNSVRRSPTFLGLWFEFNCFVNDFQ